MRATSALMLLANTGFDPVYGARPLKRAIQQLLENPLASRILAREFGNGDTVPVEAEQGMLVFRKRPAGEDDARATGGR